MSFRIGKHTALLANGFRAALRGQLVRAIKELDISSRAARPARIHSARKRAKKVRTAMRLLDDASFPGVTKTDRDLLRDAAAQVAAPRTADANIRALEKLCSKSGSDYLRFSAAFDLLKKQKAGTAKETTASMHQASTLLKAALARVESWDDGSSIAWKNVLGGLKQFYKQGRSTFRKAAKDATVKNLHEWRKSSKDILHGLKLIQAVHPESIRPLAKNAKKLGELLGRDHDLALLQKTLHQSDIGKEKAALDKLIAARRAKLLSKALKLGAKYFSRKPGAFIKKIDR